MSLVYLAGPIENCSYEESSNWREYVKDCLTVYGIDCLDPLRGKHMSSSGEWGPKWLVDDDAITDRDRFDVMRCDVVLMNLTNANRANGSMIELGWADILRKPVVMVDGPDSPFSRHGMVRSIASYRVADLEEAIRVIRCMFSEVV